MTVALVDYGVGNILSVARALEAVGADFVRTVDAAVVASARHVIVPGVGAFSACMERLAGHGLVDPLRAVSLSGRPMLGICVGMQMLFERSEEFGSQAGLGLVPGSVRKLAQQTPSGERSKIPHIGWNALIWPGQGADWSDTPLDTTATGTHFYFLHSFAGYPASDNHLLACAAYGGREVPAVVRIRNTYGVQFHPEKSGPAGLELLRRFMSL